VCSVQCAVCRKECAGRSVQIEYKCVQSGRLKASTQALMSIDICTLHLTKVLHTAPHSGTAHCSLRHCTAPH
jgi:hypothetical protein